MAILHASCILLNNNMLYYDGIGVLDVFFFWTSPSLSFDVIATV